MARYVAFLRGVSPSNARMADLRRCFEAAGFGEVCTVLSSGNVVFSAKAASEAVLERRAEAAMQQGLGRSFRTLVRPTKRLQALLAADPFADLQVDPAAKCVVTFLGRDARPLPALPIEHQGVRILHARGQEVFTAYLPHPKGPVFMTLLEKTFGSDITTRTLDTVARCAAA